MLPQPAPQIAAECEEFNRVESSVEDTLHALMAAFPFNRDLVHTHIKVITISQLYSARVLSMQHRLPDESRRFLILMIALLLETSALFCRCITVIRRARSTIHSPLNSAVGTTPTPIRCGITTSMRPCGLTRSRIVSPSSSVGGKVLFTKSRRVRSRVAVALRMAAQSLHHAKDYLGEFSRRITRKLGRPQAITATAHKLARIVYHLLGTKEAYNESVFHNCEADSIRRAKSRLRRQAAQLGFQIIPAENG